MAEIDTLALFAAHALEAAMLVDAGDRTNLAPEDIAMDVMAAAIATQKAYDAYKDAEFERAASGAETAAQRLRGE
jgi:hypothetical protein